MVPFTYGRCGLPVFHAVEDLVGSIKPDSCLASIVTLEKGLGFQKAALSLTIGELATGLSEPATHLSQLLEGLRVTVEGKQAASSLHTNGGLVKPTRIVAMTSGTVEDFPDLAQHSECQFEFDATVDVASRSHHDAERSADRVDRPF
jgi:hypothetical protein